MSKIDDFLIFFLFIVSVILLLALTVVGSKLDEVSARPPLTCSIGDVLIRGGNAYTCSEANQYKVIEVKK